MDEPSHTDCSTGAFFVLAILATSCEAPATCDEDPRAQHLMDTVDLQVGDIFVTAELATDAAERERGWQFRRCDRTALLLVPDTPGPLPIWGCALVDPIDAAFIRDAQVIDAHRVDPCSEPCETCPIVGESLHVDAVLELPADRFVVEPGTPVVGLAGR